MAEFDRDLIHVRTKAARAAAKGAGLEEVTNMKLAASVALALAATVMHMSTASARTVAGFEVPYTFNPIRTGPGWNDSDVWVVTLDSNVDGAGICTVYRHEEGSNMSVFFAFAYAHSESQSGVWVLLGLERDEGKQFPDTPAELEFFKDGLAQMSLQGTLSAKDGIESWRAVLTPLQLHALVESATKGRVSANFSASNNGWSATVENLITSPNRLVGELFPEETFVFRSQDFTECVRRAKIIGGVR
jgi:hypothetical protein